MHEATVIAGIIDAVLKELEKYDVVKVNAVTMTVGDLTLLGTEQMQFAYEVMSKDTILEGSEIRFESESVVLHCKKCGFEGPARMIDLKYDGEHNIPVLACSECGGPVKVIKGQACCVKNIDIECGDE